MRTEDLKLPLDKLLTSEEREDKQVKIHISSSTTQPFALVPQVEENNSRGQKIVGLDVLMPRYYEMQQQRALTRGNGAKRAHRHSRGADAVTTVGGNIDKGFWTRTRQNSFVAPASDNDEEVSFTQGAGSNSDDEVGWTDQSAIIENGGRGKKTLLQLKQIASSLDSTPRSSATENNSEREPGMRRLGKSQVTGKGY